MNKRPRTEEEESTTAGTTAKPSFTAAVRKYLELSVELTELEMRVEKKRARINKILKNFPEVQTVHGLRRREVAHGMTTREGADGIEHIVGRKRQNSEGVDGHSEDTKIDG